jgi:8-oxo-dGTP pyrophosphatase MutT (NUDIX family)
MKPNGSQGLYGVVETRRAVGVVALTARHEVYLVGQYRFPLERYSWEIIEGAVEEDETPLEAAKRELKEEAGLTAASWTPLLHEIHLSSCFTDEKAFVFLAKDLHLGASSPDDTEVLRIQTQPLDACITLVDDGTISDGLSIIALLHLKKLLLNIP